MKYASYPRRCNSATCHSPFLGEGFGSLASGEKLGLRLCKFRIGDIARRVEVTEPGELLRQ